MQNRVNATIQMVQNGFARYLIIAASLLITASASAAQLVPSKAQPDSIRDRLFPPQIGSPATPGNASPFAGAIDGNRRAKKDLGDQLANPNRGLTVPYWSDSFSYRGITYKYDMVGADPKRGSATTIVPTVIIPMRFVFENGLVFDASTDLIDGQTSVQGMMKVLQRINWWK